MSDCKIIDISHHQGTPDFRRVAADGVIAMIHKATQGTSNVDECRAENIVNAMNAGIACCTYHFLEHGNISAQMQHYARTVEFCEGERVVIDYEDWPDHSMVDIDDLVEAAKWLLSDPRDLQVTVYGSESKLMETLSNLDEQQFAVLQQTDLWVAHYGVAAPEQWPDVWNYWTLFQYSEDGQIDGVSGSLVDLNRFNGSDENLIEWISPATGDRPQPGPDIPISIALTIPDDVALTISVNGEVIFGEQS